MNHTFVRSANYKNASVHLVSLDEFTDSACVPSIGSVCRKTALCGVHSEFVVVDDPDGSTDSRVCNNCLRKFRGKEPKAYLTVPEDCSVEAVKKGLDKTAEITTHIALLFNGQKDAACHFWEFTCPCGVKVNFPVNKLPEKDTLFPCGNPQHWIVKFV